MLGYEAANVLAAALEKTGGRAEGLPQALVGIKDFKGLADTFSFDRFGDVMRPYYLGVNQAFVHLMGYPDREALLKVNAADLYLDPEDRERWRAKVEHDGIVRDFEKQFKRYDGTAIWVKNASRVIRDSEGQVLYYEGSLEDITERIRLADQILANLCVNARDAIGGVGKVTIETQKAVLDDAYCTEHEGSSPGEYVMLAVSDNGSGMEKATMDKIFDPFSQPKRPASERVCDSPWSMASSSRTPVVFAC